jgi:tetratricopeptide (TPR) repeat protein
MRSRLGSRRSCRIGLYLAITGGMIGAASWFLTRFDPVGRASTAFDRRQYLFALQAAQAHLEWYPNDRRASLLAARCLMRLGRYTQAEASYRKAAPLDLADAHARAYNLVNLNEPKRAVLAYDELLKRWPDDVLALKRVAAVRMGTVQWRDALDLAGRLIAIPGEEVAGQTMAGIAHHELKHYDQAVTSWLRVLEIDNDLKQMPLPRVLFWNNLSIDLIAGGRAEEARRYLTRALADCQDAGLMELLGLTYSQQGAIDDAERCWRQAESWDPNNADVCLDLGRLALSRNRWSEAVDLLQRAADRSTDAIGPFYNLSQAYRMLGNVVEAERYRRLADLRRRSRPVAATGMGAGVDLESNQMSSGVGSPESAR